MDEAEFTDKLFWYAGNKLHVVLQDAGTFRKECDKVAWVSIRLFCCFDHAYDELQKLTDLQLLDYIFQSQLLYNRFADDSDLSKWMLRLFDQYRTVLQLSHQVAWSYMTQTTAKLVASGRPFLHLNPLVVDTDTPEGAAVVERHSNKEGALH